MAWKSELDSIEKVIDWYSQSDYTNFTIYAGYKMDDNYVRSEYKGTDKEIGTQKLYESLESIKSNPQNTNSYLIHITTGVKKIGICNTFQLNRVEQPFTPYGYMQQHQPNNELLSRLASIESKLDFEDEEEEVVKDKGIAGIFDNPQMHSAIIALISGLGARLLTPQEAKPSAISGIDELSLWNQARTILAKKGVTGEDIMLLANMSNDNPVQFNILLKMLRK